MRKIYKIVKRNSRYLVDFGTHEMVYDEQGVYLGQVQPEESNVGEAFIHAIDGGISFRGLVVPIPNLTPSEITKLEFIGE